MKQFRNTRYYISESGEVWKDDGRLLKPFISHGRGSSYFRVQLQIDGIGKHFRVHRLVAECYIPNVDNKDYVDHVDNDSFNNHVSNLAWVTNSENNLNKKVHNEVD